MTSSEFKLGTKSQVISFRNDENTVLDASVFASVVDQDGNIVSGWNVVVNP